MPDGIVPKKKIIMVKKPLDNKDLVVKNKDSYTSDDSQGIIINNRTGLAEPKPHVRVLIKNPKTRVTTVTDSNGKKVWSGRDDTPKGERELDSITKETNRIMEKRESNAKVYNTGSSKK